MCNENESILKFLEESGSELMIAYFKECKESSSKPNYSEFCRKYLNGETKEGVHFNSIKVKRKELTEFLRNKYILWCELH